MENSGHLNHRVLLKYLHFFSCSHSEIIFKIITAQWGKTRWTPAVSRESPPLTCQSSRNGSHTTRVIPDFKQVMCSNRKILWLLLLDELSWAKVLFRVLQKTETSLFPYQLASQSDLSNVFILKSVGKLLSQSPSFRFKMRHITTCGLWEHGGVAVFTMCLHFLWCV